MSFLDVGNGTYWPKNDAADPDLRQEALSMLDDLTTKTLVALQKIIQQYVNIGADAELQALNDCVAELLRGASQCRQENKKYEISDNENSDLN